MGDFFKTTQQDVTTTLDKTQSSQLNPFGVAQPGLNAAIGQLTGAIDQGPFQGSFIGDQSQFTNQALQGFSNRVSDPSALQNANQQSVFNSLNFANPELQPLRNIAGGGLLGGNPFAQQAFEAGAAPLREQFGQAVNSDAGRFSSAGRLRGGGPNVTAQFDRREDALARGLGTLAAQTFFPGFAQQDQQRFSAASQLPQFALGSQQLQQGAQASALNFGQAGLGNLNALLQGGGVQDARNQLVAGDAVQQFNEPFNFAQRGIGAIAPVAAQFGEQTGESTTTQVEETFGPSPFSQVAGLAATAAGAYFGVPINGASLFGGGGTGTGVGAGLSPFAAQSAGGFASGGLGLL